MGFLTVRFTHVDCGVFLPTDASLGAGYGLVVVSRAWCMDLAEAGWVGVFVFDWGWPVKRLLPAFRDIMWFWVLLEFCVLMRLVLDTSFRAC
eukprot:gene3165-2147_t